MRPLVWIWVGVVMAGRRTLALVHGQAGDQSLPLVATCSSQHHLSPTTDTPHHLCLRMMATASSSKSQALPVRSYRSQQSRRREWSSPALWCMRAFVRRGVGGVGG